MPKKKVEKKDEIEISLDSLAIPGAIVVAGLIVAGAIFLSNRQPKSDSDVDSDQQPTEEQQEEFPQATTTISDSPYLGNKDTAKIAIVEFTDYLCSFCERHATQTKPSLISEYVDSGQAIYVIRNFPLGMFGQLSDDLANASLCVNELGGVDKFFEFYSQAFSQESTETLSAMVQGLGVNMDRYNACMSENRFKSAIEADLEAGKAAGVQGTPGFVVGLLDKDGNVEGKFIGGAYPFESFKGIIDELQK